MSNVFQERLVATGLRARHHEVLVLIARGRSNSEIGRALGITEETVKTHVSHILDALDARDRAHAVANAYRRDLFPVDPNTPAPSPERLLAKEVAATAKVLLWDHLTHKVAAERRRHHENLYAVRGIA